MLSRIGAIIKGKTCLILLAYEVTFYLYLRTSKVPDYYGIPNWLWLLTFLSLFFLTALERKNQPPPFPFLTQLTKGGYIAYSIVSLIVFLGVGSLYGLLHTLLPSYIPTPFSLTVAYSLTYSFAAYLHAGISEESIKIAVTNSVWILKIDRKRRLSRVLVTCSGTTAIALWTFMHYAVGYPVPQVIAIFVLGMVVFAIEYKSKNYLPAIVAHTLSDFHMVVPHISFLVRFFI